MDGVLAITQKGNDHEFNLLQTFRSRGLGGVEVRADLQLKATQGDRDQLYSWIRKLRDAGFDVLLTLRLPSHGGVYEGSEQERVEIYKEGLTHGAHLIDIEWGSEALDLLPDGFADRLVVSQHKFDGPIHREELNELTHQVESRCNPYAIKVVPTAHRLRDALEVLSWVREGKSTNGAYRVGFSMGASGAFSRILALAFGSKFTYASLGKPVAPGQISLRELLELYKCQELKSETEIFGVLGSNALTSFSPYLHNPSFQKREINAVYLPFQVEEFSEMTEVMPDLEVKGLSVTIPFKEDVKEFADRCDERSTAAGAANTLVVESDGGGSDAFNTDYDGVILPLKQRLGSIEGKSIGIIGNGGACRGAAKALQEAKANPYLYYRNIEKGAKVSSDLGVPGALLDEMGKQYHDAWINATPVGTKPGDESPLKEVVFTSVQESEHSVPIAFDMIYQPAWTPMLKLAQAYDAPTIQGREMLIAQGTVQFELFTGQSVSIDEFSANYEFGEELRESQDAD